MAQKYVVLMVDDLTGETIEEHDAESIRFAWNGEHRIIDLSKDHAAEMRKALDPYLSHSRRIESSGKATAPRSSRASNQADDMDERRKIREWAKQAGKHVSDRGRISANIVEEYQRTQRAS